MKKIFVIGDSTWRFVHDVAIANPPINTSIIETGSEADYDGKGLEYWKTGTGNSTLDANYPFDLVWIYNLSSNDFNGWFLGEYASMQAYLDAWREFYLDTWNKYKKLIIHSTGYIYRIDNIGRPTCGSQFGGTLTPSYEPTGTTLVESVNQRNAVTRGFNELLMEQNQDLINAGIVSYIDSFNQIAQFSSPDNWFDHFVPENADHPEPGDADDCFHMPPESYLEWYGRFLSSWFTNYNAPNVVITNTTITNTAIK